MFEMEVITDIYDYIFCTNHREVTLSLHLNGQNYIEERGVQSNIK